MRKIITLLAAAALTVSPFAFAEDTTGNPNDVLQTVGQPGGSTQEATGGPLADASATTPSASTDSSAAMSTDKPVAKKHKHKKCHNCKYKKHHKKHAKKASTTPSTTDGSTTAAPGTMDSK